jgi:hypothetical protein
MGEAWKNVNERNVDEIGILIEWERAREAGVLDTPSASSLFAGIR